MGCDSHGSRECKLVQLLQRVTCHWLPWYSPLTARPVEPFTHVQVCAKGAHTGMLLQHYVNSKAPEQPKYSLAKEQAKLQFNHNTDYFSTVKDKMDHYVLG